MNGLGGVPDADYDRAERVYLKMCQHYGYHNTIQSMVGVDINRPSVQCVIGKIQTGNLT